MSTVSSVLLNSVIFFELITEIGGWPARFRYGIMLSKFSFWFG